jgi:hypothetical protein
MSKRWASSSYSREPLAALSPFTFSSSASSSVGAATSYARKFIKS